MVETATPEQVGMSASRLMDLRAVMQALVDDGQYAGLATLIVRRGQIVDSRCYGKLDLAANKPVQPDSLFRIYSLTKPITAVAALILLDEGRFDLDDPVSRWIPEFSQFRVAAKTVGSELELGGLERAITFQHLLTHTSGLGYGFLDGPIEERYAAARIFSPILALQSPLPEIVHQLPTLPLVAQPGTLFSYSLSYDVLGYLIGVIAGQPFDDFLRERIFEPLGMPDTGFFVPPSKLERLGPLYYARGKAADLSVADDVAGSPYVNPGVVVSGGAGLVTSTPDYFRFASMLANGGELDGVRLLSRGALAAMTTNQLPSSAYSVGDFAAREGYGFGVGVQIADDLELGLPAGAFGWGSASGTKVQVFPREEMIVIVMAQSFVDETASNTLTKMAYEAIIT